MTLIAILHVLGVVSLLAYGLASAIKPRWVAGFLEQGLISGRGISEFRVAHGGCMIGLALFALYTKHPLVYQVVGWGWLGAVVVRIFSYLPDQPKVTAGYLVFLVTELMLGIFLLL